MIGKEVVHVHDAGEAIDHRHTVRVHSASNDFGTLRIVDCDAVFVGVREVVLPLEMSASKHLLNVADHEDVAVADTLDALRGVAPDEVFRRAVNGPADAQLLRAARSRPGGRCVPG